MVMGPVLEWSREALRLALLLGGPPLVAALLAGLLVGAVQTMTQMHEPAVALVPRLVAVLVVVLVALPWFVSRWVAFFAALVGSLSGRALSG